MSKKIITKVDIYKAADAIASEGKIPTQAAVRSKLNNCGSETTVFTHLKTWKIERLLQNIVPTVVMEKSNLVSLDEENRQLRMTLQQQAAHNENYAQELINSEKANITLKDENYQLQSTIKELQLKLTKTEAISGTLNEVTQKIQNELDLNTNLTIQKMQQTIDDLRLELKTVNETSISALRETSTRGHEALMQEKVISINLQAKIDILNKELLESKKQLHEAIMTAQVQIRSLSRQHEQLQKIIQERGLDKLPQLEKESVLKFAKEVVAYGK